MTAHRELPIGATEKSAAEMKSDHEKWRDARPTITRCTLPPCRGGVLHIGTAAEGRAVAEAHRLEKHPEAVHKPRRHLTSAQQREKAMLANEWKRKKFKGEE